MSSYMPNIAASALSRLADTREAVEEVCREVLDKLGGAPDLAFIFFSNHHLAAADLLARETCRLLGTERLLGCNGEAIAGDRFEIEHDPAVSLWAAKLPRTQIDAVHLHFERAREGNHIAGWPAELQGPWPAEAFLLGFGDPYSFPTDVMLAQLNDERRGTLMAGGMASGASGPGENRLIFGTETHSEGMVAVRLLGGVKLKSIVSQGCRPIGKPFVITRAERNLIYALGGKPALEQLQEIFRTLPTNEQALVQRGLHVGRVVSEYRDRFDHGDFIVRNVMGIDPDSGAIAVGEYLRTGQTIQFHIRDEASADAELRQLLALERDDAAAKRIGALLFTCNGRGTRLFRTPHHDANAIVQTLGELPLAGFFAAGEIGPIGGENFLHGFTASIAVLHEADDEQPL